MVRWVDLQVREFYRSAGSEPAVPPGIGTLIDRHPAFASIDIGRIGRESLLWDGGGWRIVVPDCFDGPQLAQAVARCAARWIARGAELRVSPKRVEDLTDALLLPSPAVAICARVLGLDAGDLERIFVVPRRVAERRLRSFEPPPTSGVFTPVDIAI